MMAPEVAMLAVVMVVVVVVAMEVMVMATEKGPQQLPRLMTMQRGDAERRCRSPRRSPGYLNNVFTA